MHPIGPPRLTLVAASVLAFAAGAARADVLEIGEGGAVAVFSGPAVFTLAGAQPIEPPRARLVPALSAPTAAIDVASAIAEASDRYRVPSALVQAVAWRESRYRQTALSPKGAIGVMQLMAGTASQLGVDPYDLRQNIHGGVAYLGRLLDRYGGDATRALAAYNAGPGAVDRYRGVPPFRETRAYVAAVLTRAALPTPPAAPTTAAFVIAP